MTVIEIPDEQAAALESRAASLGLSLEAWFKSLAAPYTAIPSGLIDWSSCPLVEIIPGKVSGAPLVKNTRLPVEAITENYDAFREQGLSHDAALAETLDCYPHAGLDTIRAVLAYRETHPFQGQR